MRRILGFLMLVSPVWKCGECRRFGFAVATVKYPDRLPKAVCLTCWSGGQ